MFINSFISEEKKLIGEIPAYIIYPKNTEEKLPVIFFYHGWSSKKDNHLNIGRFLACNGYLVVLADAVNHGDRGTIDYESPASAAKYFWPTVENNIKEFPAVLEFVKSSYNIDEERIGVTGHSMGAITTSGLLANFSSLIKTAVTMNGSGLWKELTLDVIGNHYDESNEMMRNALIKIDSASPGKNIDKWINKPILILHGEADEVVPVKSDIDFYESLKAEYDNKDLVKLITLKRNNHFVTEAYINEMINWFNKYL